MTSKKKTFSAILLVILLTIFLHSIGWLNPVERGFSFLLEMGSKPANSLHNFFEERRVSKIDENTLAGEVKKIRQELQDNLVDKVQLDLLLQENKELREQLNFLSSGQYTHLGVEVIGRTVDPLGTIIVVDKGELDGIFYNNPVILGKGILVGKVVSLEKHSAMVRLINDNGSRIGAMILNGEKSIGLVEGGYGLGVHINFIPQNEIVTPGDIIVTSGLTEGMPRNLIIGTVEVVEKQPHEPFQQAVLNPIADLSHLSVLSVITHVDQSNDTYDEEII